MTEERQREERSHCGGRVSPRKACGLVEGKNLVNIYTKIAHVSLIFDFPQRNELNKVSTIDNRFNS